MLARMAGAEERGPAGLVPTVMAALQAHIRSNGLAPGDVLPSENAIAEQLDVSRAVVREAYRSMATLKLIDIGNGRRARVSAMDPSVLALVLDHVVQTNQITVQQILDVRRTVEMRTVGLAALRRSDGEAAEIAGQAASMRNDFADAARVMEHDIAFHEGIARASKNPMFALIVASFHVVTRQTWPIGWRARATDADRLANVACHEAIAAAIGERDRLAAETLMAEHFDNTVKILLAAGIN
jgi:GntR family transcriptional regulator, transcriptional repressor for pyruvate dehydrogenase complex